MEREKDRILLIHGFHRTYSDMTPLRKHLLKMGYRVSRINLPLTFKTVEEATLLFKEIAEKKIPRLKPGEKIHLVGHSTGGLIIRHFLAVSDFMPYIGRCVLIATPNQGYPLAVQAAKLSKTYISIYKTMDSLQPERVHSLKMIGSEVEIGAIAGTKSRPFISNFIEGPNDGRLATDAVFYPELKDFVTVPFHHMEIHKKEETAELVDLFIQTGSFTETEEAITSEADLVKPFEPKQIVSKSLSWTLRSARIADADALSKLRVLIDGETEFLDREPGEDFLSEGDFAKRISTDLSSRRSLFLVAEVEGQIVGFARCVGNSLHRFNHVGSFGICILRDYWGMGIGKELLATIVEWSESVGLDKIALSVIETNTSAISLYKRFGFVVEGILERDRKLSDGKLYNTVLMARFRDEKK